MSGNKFRSVTSNNMGFDLVLIVRYIIMAIQGSAKRLRPGLVNMRRTNSVFQPASGRTTQ